MFSQHAGWLQCPDKGGVMKIGSQLSAFKYFKLQYLLKKYCGTKPFISQSVLSSGLNSRFYSNKTAMAMKQAHSKICISTVP